MVTTCRHQHAQWSAHMLAACLAGRCYTNTVLSQQRCTATPPPHAEHTHCGDAAEEVWARVAAHASLQLLHSHPCLVRVWVRYLSPHHVASVICSTSHCNAPAAITHSASIAETHTHMSSCLQSHHAAQSLPKGLPEQSRSQRGARYADAWCEPAQRVSMACLVELKAHLGDTSCPPAQTLPHILPAAAAAGRCPVDATQQQQALGWSKQLTA